MLPCSPEPTQWNSCSCLISFYRDVGYADESPNLDAINMTAGERYSRRAVPARSSPSMHDTLDSPRSILRIVLGRVSCGVTLSIIGRGIRSRKQTSVPIKKRPGGIGPHSMGIGSGDRRYASECFAGLIVADLPLNSRWTISFGA